MTIDEAIADEKEIANMLYNQQMPNGEYYHKQLVAWLEELKEYKENQHRSLRHMYEKGYNKAIDDFVKFASDMPTVEEEDGEIRPMWLEEIAEQLKEGGKNE